MREGCGAMSDQTQAYGVEGRQARHLGNGSAESRGTVRVREKTENLVLEQLPEVLRGEGAKLLAAERLDALERAIHRGAKHPPGVRFRPCR